MPCASTAVRGPVRYGFEPEDIGQEAAIGRLLAERKHPGNKLAAFLRARVRIARHRRKEGLWNSIRVPILDHDRAVAGLQFERALIHEILDLLPYSKREEVLIGMLSGDGRVLRRLGRVIRKLLPGILKD